MRGYIAIASLLAGVIVVGGVYDTERLYDAAADRSRLVESRIEAAEREIHVLEAEWSYQTRPARIEELAARYLPLKPTAPERVVADPAALQTAIDHMDGIVEASSTGGVK